MYSYLLPVQLYLRLNGPACHNLIHNIVSNRIPHVEPNQRREICAGTNMNNNNNYIV